MTGSDNSAIARLEVQVQHLTENGKKLEATLERVASQLNEVQDTLSQSEGGLRVLRWLGFGSLGGLLAAGAAVYHFIKGA